MVAQQGKEIKVRTRYETTGIFHITHDKDIPSCVKSTFKSYNNLFYRFEAWQCHELVK
jgi:hypothetical protein